MDHLARDLERPCRNRAKVVDAQVDCRPVVPIERDEGKGGGGIQQRRDDAAVHDAGAFGIEVGSAGHGLDDYPAPTSGLHSHLELTVQGGRIHKLLQLRGGKARVSEPMLTCSAHPTERPEDLKTVPCTPP